MVLKSHLVLAAVGFLCFALGASGAAENRKGKPVVIGTSYELHSTALDETRRINVFLPPGYSDEGRNFPVLYLIDGGEKADFHHITGLAHLGAIAHMFQQMIVVGIHNNDRYRDLTSPSQISSDRERLPTSGGAKAYREYLVEELQPYVEKHYRTNGEKAIIGESLAGLFILETFLLHPESYDTYVCISPSLWWDGQSLMKAADQALRRPLYSGKRLYLSHANELDIVAGVEKVVEALKAHAPQGLKWTYDPRPQETHGTVYHPVAMSALKNLYPVK